jgi:hypothetical protein
MHLSSSVSKNEASFLGNLRNKLVHMLSKLLQIITLRQWPLDIHKKLSCPPSCSDKDN